MTQRRSETLDALESLVKRAVLRVLRFFLGKTSSPLPLDVSIIRSILVVRQHDQLGDMLCAVPLLRALRSNFRDASIVLVTSPVNHQIMLHNPFVDHVWEYDKRSVRRIIRLYRLLRSTRFDLAIVPATVSISTTSNILALISGAPWRIGPAKLNGKANDEAFMFSIPVDLEWSHNPRTHQAIRNLDILQPLGISSEDLSGSIKVTEDEAEKVRREIEPLRAGNRLIVGFHPGAGKSTNRWPAERFAAVAEVLHTKFHAAIVITSGPMDVDAVEAMTSRLRVPFTLVKGRQIREVAALIGQLDLFISNDTGIMHVAGGTDTRLLALFGPTDPHQWAPVGKKNRYIASRDYTMDSIEVEEVISVAEVIIAEMKRV